jgi:hypothetical protein
MNDPDWTSEQQPHRLPDELTVGRRPASTSAKMDATPPAPTSAKHTDETALRQVISLIERLLTAQLGHHPKYITSTLMVNDVAAGYVLGFHDSAFKIFGIINRNDPEADFSIIQRSYEHIFGRSAGCALFDRSKHLHNSDFSVGRLHGGEEYALFTHQGVPPLGLQWIIAAGS